MVLQCSSQNLTSSGTTATFVRVLWALRTYLEAAHLPSWPKLPSPSQGACNARKPSQRGQTRGELSRSLCMKVSKVDLLVGGLTLGMSSR